MYFSKKTAKFLKRRLAVQKSPKERVELKIRIEIRNLENLKNFENQKTETATIKLYF